MLGSSALELGIGLSLFFLLVSLICSAAREAVETVMKSRARDLERGLRAMLDDPDGTMLTSSLLAHGQLGSLFDGRYDPAALRRTWLGTMHLPRAARSGFPSYIPATQFANTIIDVVARGPGDWPYPVDSTPLSLSALRQSVALLPNTRVQRVMLSAIDHSGGDLVQLRAELEQWFNGSMDRVSGWYKRRTQAWLFGIGLVAAIVLNLDTLTVAARLNDDESFRKAVVAQAEVVQQQGLPALQAKAPDEIRAQLTTTGYPIGWRQSASGWPVPDPQTCAGDARGCPDRTMNIGSVLLMIVGWLITAVACTFGAPFWFDVLNRFMIVRSTIKPAQKSPDEASADPQPKPAPVVAAMPDAAHAAPASGGAPLPHPEMLASGPGPVPAIATGDVLPQWRPGFVNHGEIDL